MSGTPHISSEDLALIALGALSPEETAAFEPHIASCEQCRHEVAELRGDMSLLALSAPQQLLPAAARTRFLASIGVDSAANPASAPILASAEAPKAVIPAATPATATASVISMPAKPAAPRFFNRLWYWQTIAAILLILLGFHAYQVHQLKSELRENGRLIATLEDKNQSLATSSAKARQALTMLTAPNAQHVLLTAAHTAPEPEGRLTYIADSGSLLFLANHLKPLPAGKTYELWIIPASGAAPIPAGIFQADASGNGRVILPQIPQGVAAKAFGVTMEQAAGSPTPTSPILISGAAS